MPRVRRVPAVPRDSLDQSDTDPRSRGALYSDTLRADDVPPRRRQCASSFRGKGGACAVLRTSVVEACPSEC